METIVVGSFPEVAWAEDLRGILRNAGIAAETEDHGPRAHQVVIPDIQEDQALPVLDEIGYLNCPVPPVLGFLRRRSRPGGLGFFFRHEVNQIYYVVR